MKTTILAGMKPTAILKTAEARKAWTVAPYWDCWLVRGKG
jgi:hypothetical protein